MRNKATLRPISTHQKRTLSGWGLGLLLALGALFSGCSSDDEVFTTPFTPTVIAVTAPDTLSPGRALEVKIHWRRTNGCQILNDLPFIPINDSTWTIIVKGVEVNDGNDLCPEDIAVVENSFRLENPPQKRFTLSVTGKNELFEFIIEGGKAAAAVERHRILVKNKVNGMGDPAATVRIIGVPANDTLAVLTTDADGMADTTLTCPGGGSRQYILDVMNTRGRTAILEYRTDPARCGVPEWAQVSI
jgi:hypothetical protein